MKNRLVGMLILFTLSPIVTFADGFAENRWGNHTGYMGAGWGNHMGFMGAGWMMILWVGLLILITVVITRWAIAPKKNLAFTTDARSILAERYAKSEITQQEFLEMKKQLE